MRSHGASRFFTFNEHFATRLISEFLAGLHIMVLQPNMSHTPFASWSRAGASMLTVLYFILTVENKFGRRERSFLRHADIWDPLSVVKGNAEELRIYRRYVVFAVQLGIPSVCEWRQLYAGFSCTNLADMVAVCFGQPHKARHVTQKVTGVCRIFENHTECLRADRSTDCCCALTMQTGA